MSDDIQFLLGKILTNQDNFMKKLEDHIIEDRKILDKVLGIETKINYFSGILAAVAIGWGLVSHFVMRKLGIIT